MNSASEIKNLQITHKLVIDYCDEHDIKWIPINITLEKDKTGRVIKKPFNDEYLKKNPKNIGSNALQITSDEDLKYYQKFYMKYDYIGIDTTHINQIDIDDKDQVEKYKFLNDICPSFLSCNKRMPHFFCNYLHKTNLNTSNNNIIFKHIDFLTGQWSYCKRDETIINGHLPIIDIDYKMLKISEEDFQKNFKNIVKAPKMSPKIKQEQCEELQIDLERDQEVVKLIKLIKYEKIDSYSSWLDCMWALRNDFGDLYKEDFKNISKMSPKFDEESFETNWNNFNSDKCDLHIGTIIALSDYVIKPMHVIKTKYNPTYPDVDFVDDGEIIPEIIPEKNIRSALEIKEKQLEDLEEQLEGQEDQLRELDDEREDLFQKFDQERDEMLKQNPSNRNSILSLTTMKKSKFNNDYKNIKSKIKDIKFKIKEEQKELKVKQKETNIKQKNEKFILDCENVKNETQNKLIEFNKNHFLCVSESIYYMIRDDVKKNYMKTKEQLKTSYSNNLCDYIILKKNGELDVKTKNIVDVWVEWPLMRTYTYTEFRPYDYGCKNILKSEPTIYDLKFEAKLNGTIFNKFLGLSTELSPSKVEIYETYKNDIEYFETAVEFIKEHVRYLCDYNQENIIYFETWIHYLFRYPSHRTNTAIFLKSDPGSGKDMSANVLGKVLGDDYYAATTELKTLFGDFNATTSGKLLLCVSEMKEQDMLIYEEQIKAIITNETKTITFKGVDTIKEDNYTHLIFLTNEPFPIKVQPKQRRHAFIECNQPVKPPSYFATLKKYTDNHLVRKLYYEEMCDIKYDPKKDFDFLKFPQNNFAKSITEVNIGTEVKFITDYLDKQIIEISSYISENLLDTKNLLTDNKYKEDLFLYFKDYKNEYDIYKLCEHDKKIISNIENKIKYFLPSNTTKSEYLNYCKERSIRPISDQKLYYLLHKYANNDYFKKKECSNNCQIRGYYVDLNLY